MWCARARTLARAHALPVTKTGHGSGPHRRRLDKLVCLSVSTHASVNTYGVDGRKEGELAAADSSAPKANDAKSPKNNRP